MEKREGLSESEVKKLLSKHGFNEIKETNKISFYQILYRQIKNNFIIYLLTVAMIISFFVGKNITAYTILAVIILVISTGFIQEYKAEKAIVSLRDMLVPVSIVIRDGREQEISTKEIVPGDILILRNGEKIPADCIILEGKNLLINESILTGESTEIKKFAVKDKTNYKDENTLFTGSFIVGGRCIAEVINTGMKTKFGKIARMISGAEKELLLQKKVNKITKYMATIGIIVSILVGIIMLLQSKSLSSDVIINVLILVIAISVSAFPEGFPVVLITSLSVGAYKMAKKNAIVNRMSIIETLGETTIICSDKTGTITKGEMTVREVYTDYKKYSVTGVGYEGNGEFLFNEKKIDPLQNENLNLLIKSAVICNDTQITRTGEDKTYNVMGIPTEGALLVMGAKAGIYKEELYFERKEDIPFSSERKMMSVLCQEKKEERVYTKGAFEFLIDKCKYIQRKDGIFTLLERDKKRLAEINNQMTSKALRVIAIAYKKGKKIEEKEFEEDLIFLGMVGMEDPPREEVKEAIELCKKTGIKVCMITGDNKETALAIANQINLGKGGVLEGKEINNLTDAELVKAVRSVVVYARVKPEHKLRIVKALKENKEIVTMTGDGVNDAPALKEAHIGVAMGKGGTDVSRSASDLILKDDNFATIVDAIKEGRTIFKNIRKFVGYQLSCNFAELMILFIAVLFAPWLGWPVPILLALHILFMNLVTDNLPAITLGFNPSSKDIMEEKPRESSDILNRNMFALIAFTGTIMAFFTLLIFYISFNIVGESVEYARTAALVTLIVLEIAGAFVFRSFRKGVLNRSPFVNKALFIASTVSIIATLLIIYTPLKRVFETAPITLIDWTVAVFLLFLFIAIFDILKKINGKKKFWSEEKLTQKPF